MLLAEKMKLIFANQCLQNVKNLNRAQFAQERVSLLDSCVGLKVEGGCSVRSQFVGNGPCFIGYSSYINNGGYLRVDSGGIFVGRYCSFGRRLTLAAGRHVMSSLSTSPYLRGKKARLYSKEENDNARVITRQESPLVIESDVWIGDGVVVMPGVRVGVGAVIAANAVVTKDVAAYEIHGGVPAKKIGMRFSQSVVDRLLESEWWECEHSYLNSLPLSNIFEFLEKFEHTPAHFPTFNIVWAPSEMDK